MYSCPESLAISLEWRLQILKPPGDCVSCVLEIDEASLSVGKIIFDTDRLLDFVDFELNCGSDF